MLQKKRLKRLSKASNSETISTNRSTNKYPNFRQRLLTIHNLSLSYLNQNLPKMKHQQPSKTSLVMSHQKTKGTWSTSNPLPLAPNTPKQPQLLPLQYTLLARRRSFSRPNVSWRLGKNWLTSQKFTFTKTSMRWYCSSLSSLRLKGTKSRLWFSQIMLRTLQWSSPYN